MGHLRNAQELTDQHQELTGQPGARGAVPPAALELTGRLAPGRLLGDCWGGPALAFPELLCGESGGLSGAWCRVCCAIWSGCDMVRPRCWWERGLGAVRCLLNARAMEPQRASASWSLSARGMLLERTCPEPGAHGPNELSGARVSRPVSPRVDVRAPRSTRGLGAATRAQRQLLGQVLGSSWINRALGSQHMY